MTRPIRFTVRLSDEERLKIEQFADDMRVIPSVAIRMLIAAGLRARASNEGLSDKRENDEHG